MIYTVSNDIIDWIQQPKIIFATIVLVTIFVFLTNLIFRYNFKDQLIEQNKNLEDEDKIDVEARVRVYDIKQLVDSSIVAIIYIAIMLTWHLKVYRSIVGDNVWANLIPILLVLVTTIIYDLCHKDDALMSLYHMPTLTAFNKISENSKNDEKDSMKPSFMRSVFFVILFICKCLVMGVYIIISAIANIHNCAVFFPLFYGLNLLINKAKRKKTQSK